MTRRSFERCPRIGLKQPWLRVPGPSSALPKASISWTLTIPRGGRIPPRIALTWGRSDRRLPRGWTGITKGDLFTWEGGYGWSVEAPRRDCQYQGSESLDTAKVFRYGAVQNQELRRTFKRRQRSVDIAPVRVYGDPSLFYGEHRDTVTQPKALLHAGPKRGEESTG
jgi:hypothetical protein